MNISISSISIFMTLSLQHTCMRACLLQGQDIPPPPVPPELLVAGEDGEYEGAGEEGQLYVDGDDDNCGDLWAIIAHVWRLGCILLTHEGRCLLHMQLQNVRLAQAAAAAGGAGAQNSFMHLPPKTPYVQTCVSECFQLFDLRIHADLMKNVCACVRALTRYVWAAPSS